MKTQKKFLGGLMLVLLLTGIATGLQAQGKGNNPGRGHDKENHPDKGHDKQNSGRGHDHHVDWDRHDRDHRDFSHHNRGDHFDGYQRGRYVTYYHRFEERARWAPVYGHRYNTRYIYYRDYNVYYDCYRDVFVTWTGRNWIISAKIPAVMYRVDFNRTAVVGVDYWDDDFDFYVTKRRPAYVSISASW